MSALRLITFDYNHYSLYAGTQKKCSQITYQIKTDNYMIFRIFHEKLLYYIFYFKYL